MKPCFWKSDGLDFKYLQKDKKEKKPAACLPACPHLPQAFWSNWQQETSSLPTMSRLLASTSEDSVCSKSDCQGNFRLDRVFQFNCIIDPQSIGIPEPTIVSGPQGFEVESMPNVKTFLMTFPEIKHLFSESKTVRRCSSLVQQTTWQSLLTQLSHHWARDQACLQLPPISPSFVS